MARLGITRVLVTLVCLAAILLIWDVFARSVAKPKLFPWPRTIVQQSLPRFALEPQTATPMDGLLGLGSESLKTVLRVAISTTVGTAAGLSVALLLFFPLKELTVVNFLFKTLRGIPLLAIIPLFVLWFGDREIPSVYGYISYAVAIIIASDAYTTASTLPEGLLATAKLAGAGRLKTLRILVAPAVGHHIVGSLDTVIGLAWAFAVGAELIVLKHGLGHLLHTSYFQTDVGSLIILAITYALLGWLSVHATHVLRARISQNGEPTL